MPDDLNQETEIPGCQLHKNDVPFWSSGTAYRVILAVLLVVFGLGFAGYIEDIRIGLLDGVVGLAAGALLALPLQNPAHWEQVLLRQKAGRRQIIDLDGLRQLPAFALAAAISWAVGWSAHNWASLAWPWCGDPPTMLPGIIGFAAAVSYRYIAWYDSLPD